MITKQIVAAQLVKYLNYQMTLAQFVDWEEKTVMEGNIEPNDTRAIMQPLGRLGVADVNQFGLLWEDCEAIMRSLGYDIKVDAVLAA